MSLWIDIFFLASSYPLWLAWQANRRTALFQALNWAIVAWGGWGWVELATWEWWGEAPVPIRYLALCLTGCAGVAVLGARRPGVGAWNFVIIGLLAVLLLPLAEMVFPRGQLRLEWFRLFFLGATLAVGILNYLPTRLAPAALVLALACGIEVLGLTGPETLANHAREIEPFSRLLLALVPWLAYGGIRLQPPARSEFDRLWLDYRNRFGLVWAQRLREQFNRSAAHAGLPVHLHWQGLRLDSGQPFPGPSEWETMLATLRALMKRFGPE